MDANCWGKMKGREQKIQDYSQAHQFPFEIGEAADALPRFPLLGTKHPSPMSPECGLLLGTTVHFCRELSPSLAEADSLQNTGELSKRIAADSG